MGKGALGIETNTIIKMPERKKIKCDCKKCMYQKNKVCELGRKPTSSKCKWFAMLNDYNLNSEEREEIKNTNNISKEERNKRAKYNEGFGNIKVEKVDLSKYRGLK